MQVIGLDACRGKWLALTLENGRYANAVLTADAAALAAESREATAIGVDIPIGLPEAPWREADRAAREFVGDRRSSVFPTFPSAVLESPTYEEAKAYCTVRGWPKPSVQSFGMRQRILEIAPLALRDERLFEVHPEVSFRELLGRTLGPKSTAVGVAERRLALAEAGIELPDLPYPTDDVLDAAIAAWSAGRFASGMALPLPEDTARASARSGADDSRVYMPDCIFIGYDRVRNVANRKERTRKNMAMLLGIPYDGFCARV